MKKMIAIVLLGLMLLALGGCGEKSESKTEKLQELTIGTMPDVDSIPFIIAQEKGYFKEEKVKVTLKPFKSAMDRDSALQSGNLDGAISDMLAVAFAKEGGFDVKITSLTSGSYKLVAGKDEPANSIAELKGKDVAISKNTIIEYVTDKILTEASMSGTDINKVVIPQIPTRLEMLQSGKIAAVTLPEPMASIAISNGAKLINSSDQLGINPGVMMFTKQATTDKEKELQAMYRAYNKAIAYLETEPQENYIDLLIEKGGFPPAVKGSLVLPKYQKATLPTEKDVNDCISWLKEKNLIKKLYSYQDLVMDQFIK
ncbi:MAG: ABC-type transporter, periplasmic subunit family 3 [Firmicutes bacterium]|nr:ABC-type transporter, periplasmic subunit family 3 [Bacillota bacterium]